MSVVANNGPVFNAGQQDNGDEVVNLGDLLGVVVEYRWLVVAITFSAILIGGYRAFTAVPIYQADGLLQVEESAGSMTNLDVSMMLEDYTLVQAEIEILRSRKVLGDVVDSLKLDIYSHPDQSALGAAVARRWPANERPLIRVDSLDVPDSLRGDQFRLVSLGNGRYELLDSEGTMLLRGRAGETASAAQPEGGSLSIFVSALQGDEGEAFIVGRQSRIGSIRSLKSRLTIAEQGEWSGILAISVQGEDPRSVMEQVDAIAIEYVTQNVERKTAEAQKTLEFLDNQLPIVRTEMEAAELALNSYRLKKGSIDLPMETQTILQTIVSVEAQINELRREREKVTLAFTEAHPTVVALDRQIGRLTTQLEDLNAQVRELPETQQELLRLIRDVEVSNELYTSLLSTAQELRVVKAGTVGNVRIIDKAVMPSAPIKPNRPRILMLSIVLGGLIGVASAFGLRAVRAGVEDPELIEKAVNVPVYATISHSKRQDRLIKSLRSQGTNRAVLAETSPGDAAIESLRNLRTALHFGMVNVPNNCLMIAGPSPEVGKSFVSVNLAAVLASNEKNVLLIDGDLRRGHLHEYLGLPRDKGLSEFISGEIPIGDVLHETSIPGLTLIPTGAIPPNPAELLLHKRFNNCLKVLTPRYDHIIVDSPPILAVTDANIIGQMAGATLLVLKSGEHTMREIEQSVKRLRQAGVNLRGILFNDIQMTSRRYGAGKYNYQYSYKEGE